MLEKALLIPPLLFGGGSGQSNQPPNSGQPTVVSEKVVERRCPKEGVKRVYAKLLKELIFDKRLGDELRAIKFDSVGEVFKHDVDVTKSKKRGVCRQFSHRLIYELYKICDKVYPLVVVTPESSHVAVMYEAEDGQRYVADLSGEIRYCKDFPNMYNRKNPLLFGVPLDEYTKAQGNPFIMYANETLTNNPKARHELNFISLTNHPAGPAPKNRKCVPEELDHIELKPMDIIMESGLSFKPPMCEFKKCVPKGFESKKCAPMESDTESESIECPEPPEGPKELKQAPRKQ